jgi:hypothetical protein
MSINKDPQPGDLVICETRSAVWSYHLRVIGSDGFKPGGGDITSLCGKKMGWDTRCPLDSWGLKDHLPSKWCSTCEVMAAAKKEQDGKS